MTPAPAWRPTQAQVRVVLLSALLVLVAVLARRPDAAVLGLPLGAIAVWGAVLRPRGRPQARAEMDAEVLFEGQATTLRVRVDDVDGDLDPRVDLVAMTVPRSRWFAFDPVGGGKVAIAGAGTVDVELDLRALRWGRRRIDPPYVVCTSVLGGYRTPTLRADTPLVVTLPLRDGFAAVEAVPRPAGLVGLHRSRRDGDGTEISGVRPFRVGDRLRRVNWAVSARTGELHVTTTWSDRDTEVVLLLDTSDEVGISEGVDGRSSSLDITLRAAAAIGEHYLRHGDRVRLVDTGATVRAVRAGSGRSHLRRILDVLVHADVRAADRDAVHLTRQRVRSDSLVIVLSPLLRRKVLGHLVTLAQSGCTVIVVDTLPADASEPGDHHDARSWPLAWRLRLLERRGEIERLGDLGVPTVAWQGAGTLDEVLRDASRLSAAPRVRS